MSKLLKYEYVVIIQRNPYQWDNGDEAVMALDLKQAQYFYDLYVDSVEMGNSRSVAIYKLGKPIQTIECSDKLLQKMGAKD